MKLCYNIFLGVGSKPQNQMHLLNIIHCSIEQNHKTTEKDQRQGKTGRKNIFCVMLLIISKAERKVSNGKNP